MRDCRRVAKYSTIITAPRFLRSEDAGQYVGCPGLLARMVRAGWIKPVVQRKRLTLFSRAKLDVCADRMEGGEFPEDDQEAG